MRKEQLEYGISRYGTPLYIFDLDILKEQTERIRKGLGRETGLCLRNRRRGYGKDWAGRRGSALR